MEKKKDKKKKKEEKENYKSSHNKYKRYRCIFQGSSDWTKPVKWRYKKTISSLFLGIDHLLDGWKHVKKRRWCLAICLDLTSIMFIIVQRPHALEQCRHRASEKWGQPANGHFSFILVLNPLYWMLAGNDPYPHHYMSCLHTSSQAKRWIDQKQNVRWQWLVYCSFKKLFVYMSNAVRPKQVCDWKFYCHRQHVYTLQQHLE